MSSDRVSTALSHTEFALRHLLSVSKPGEMSGRLAAKWVKLLDSEQRCLMLTVAAQAADEADIEQLAFILGAAPPFGRAS